MDLGWSPWGQIYIPVTSLTDSLVPSVYAEIVYSVLCMQGPTSWSYTRLLNQINLYWCYHVRRGFILIQIYSTMKHYSSFWCFAYYSPKACQQFQHVVFVRNLGQCSKHHTRTQQCVKFLPFHPTISDRKPLFSPIF